ncbi:putative cinnamyl-alcohol dehydrogenase [Helianthus anomalus]
MKHLSIARFSFLNRDYWHLAYYDNSYSDIMRMPLIHSFCFLVLVDIRNRIRNIEQHASDNVNKILVGNKANMTGHKKLKLINIINDRTTQRPDCRGGMLTKLLHFRYEIVGVMTEVGSKVKKVKVGDKFVVDCMVGSCRSCD